MCKVSLQWTRLFFLLFKIFNWVIYKKYKYIIYSIQDMIWFESYLKTTPSTKNIASNSIGSLLVNMECVWKRNLNVFSKKKWILFSGTSKYLAIWFILQ